jgi:cell division septation protein DedD
MPERDTQTIVLSRQSILLVTAVSVGLLTLCYVLGVQVGKQSAALRNSAARGSGEELQELPASIEDQLKTLQNQEMVKTEKITPKAEAPKAPEPEKQEPKPEPKDTKPAETKKDEPKWTLQLVSTTDPAEAQRIAAKAKAAGFATTTVKDKNTFKVRLAKPASKPDIDAAEGKLKSKGFKTYPVKAE